ncbi:hypothetical protein [Streptomyces sp. FIT100]|uniref:hypothetical protein n=1 Tax=Streptomyces sp. FIT100 TaxID=2837956 RepID=UPI0021C9A165|nr:hypothetical protein [Streptomyces sp. FIT100]UUN26328.1 hypothetical protein KK483_07770 [Streptomyces sp. FIT100]
MDTAEELFKRMAAEPRGRSSPSLYETARLLSLASWLPGHAARLRYVLKEQRPDGLWGGPGGYALVPSLSAVEALLTVVRRDRAAGTASVVGAAARGLRAVAGLLRRHPVATLPDTAAVEMIVPGLTEDIEGHMRALRTEPLDGLAPVELPSNVDALAFDRVRRRLAAGASPPRALLFSLEVLGEAAASAVDSLAPADRSMCAAPSAMAAWLRVRHDPVMRSRLETLAAAGPVPIAASLSVFERSWVLAWLLGAGVRVSPTDVVVQALEDALDPASTSAGEDLPPDGDVTPAILHALALVERPQALDALRRFATPTHFACYPGERTPSATVNAHALEALGSSSVNAGWRESAAGKVTTWLTGQQRAGGYWEDKWHASPYYATVCCTLALHRYGGPQAQAAVRRARAWVTNAQRSDGGWGIWGSTPEETSYAVRILLATGHPASAASRRGAGFLRATEDVPHRPLWHAKELYTPGTIVDASVLAALHLAEEAERVR